MDYDSWIMIVCFDLVIAFLNRTAAGQGSLAIFADPVPQSVSIGFSQSQQADGYRPAQVFGQTLGHVEFLQGFGLVTGNIMAARFKCTAGSAGPIPLTVAGAFFLFPPAGSYPSFFCKRIKTGDV